MTVVHARPRRRRRRCRGASVRLGAEGHPAGPARRTRGSGGPRDVRHRSARPADDPQERHGRRGREESRLPGHGDRRLLLQGRRALPASSGEDLRGTQGRHGARHGRASAPLEHRAHPHAREHGPERRLSRSDRALGLRPRLGRPRRKCVPKGSGSENMSFLKMCVPADGVTGIKKFVLESIVGAGGKPCPPGIVGSGSAARPITRCTGQGGDRPAGRHAQSGPLVAELEQDPLGLLNETGVGPMGLGGDVTVLSCPTSSTPTRT